MHDRGNADAARIGERLEPRRDIDAVAIDVVAVDDDVAEIDADPQLDCRFAWRQYARSDSVLNVDSAFDRVDDARELNQRSVADQLDDAAITGSDRGIEEAFAKVLQCGERAGLVAGHQARIADHIGGQNRRQPPIGLSFRHDNSSHQRAKRPPMRDGLM